MAIGYLRRVELLEGVITTTCDAQCGKCWLATYGAEEQRELMAACDGNPKALAEVLDRTDDATIERALIRSGAVKGTSDDELRALITGADGDDDELHEPH